MPVNTTTPASAKTARDQAGAALLAVIIGIVLVATIGTAIISATLSTASLQLGAVDTVGGYFLAEAGMHYAMRYIAPEMDSGGDPDAPGSGTMDLLDGKTFTLPNSAGQFHLSLSHSGCPGASCTYTLVATGIPNQRTKRSITYQITPD